MTRRFKPGDRDIPSAFLNRVGESADIVLGGRGGLPVAANGINPSVIMVRNNSGSDVPRYGVLGLGDAAITPSENSAEFYKRIYISGERPHAQNHAGRFAIAVEPIAAGKLGRCAVSGLAQCKVTISQDWHEFVDVIHGDVDGLVSAPTGTARIFWKPDDSGDRRAIISLNAAPPRTTLARLTGKATGSSEYEADEYVINANLGTSATGRSFNSDDMGNIRIYRKTASSTIDAHPISGGAGDELEVRWMRFGNTNTWRPYALSLYRGGAAFSVDLEVESGSAGTASTRATFEYRIKDKSGNVLREGVDPSSGGRSDYIRPLVGEMIAATRGLAYFPDGLSGIVLASCNERPAATGVSVVSSVDFAAENATTITVTSHGTP